MHIQSIDYRKHSVYTSSCCYYYQQLLSTVVREMGLVTCSTGFIQSKTELWIRFCPQKRGDEVKLVCREGQNEIDHTDLIGWKESCSSITVRNQFLEASKKDPSNSETQRRGRRNKRAGNQNSAYSEGRIKEQLGSWELHTQLLFLKGASDRKDRHSSVFTE